MPIWAAAPALAQTPADLMPLGAEVAVPAGFVDLCERSPEQCVATERPTESALRDIRNWAGRTRWAAVFEAAGMAPAATAAEAAPSAKPARSVRQIRQDKDAARKRGAAPPAKRRATTKPELALPPVPTPPAAAGLSLDELETVNRRVNRSIRRRTDADAFGREDVWQRPEGPRAAGDCEDYVLAKRHALIAAGVDAEALSIAIVRTRRGEMHAVLLVATPAGELVLDNLSPWVRPWREVGYDWLERQAPGRPLTWVRAAG